MNLNTLKEIINEEYIVMTPSEIDEMLENELNKPEGEMDTDIVEQCLALLKQDAEATKFNKESKRKSKIKIGKLLISVAVIILIAAIAIPVCAKYFNIDVLNSIVDHNGNRLDVAMSEKVQYSKEELLEYFKDNGINELYLPECVVDEEAVISNVLLNKSTDTENYISFYSKIKNSEFSITVCKYKNGHNSLEGKRRFNSIYSNVKEINVNNINILIFSDKDNSTLFYTMDNAEYDININCNKKDAEKIAQTIISIKGD